jgi:WD40 repeat protein
MKGRRLITSGADGTVKIWNFSNGQQLIELLSADEKQKVDTEITALISIHDTDREHPKVKAPCFLAVGWDKKLHIWLDPAYNNNGGDDGEDDDAVSCKDLPAAKSPEVHKNDIMSCTFDLKKTLIFTGGVDGTIVAWNLDTGFARYYLHEYDPTCRSEDFISDSKSVDALVIMEVNRLLISMSADQYLRFWDIDDL